MARRRFKKKLIIALIVHFFGVAGIILGRSYIDLLFLSSYPPDYLPYLFIGQTVITLLLTVGLTPLLSKGSKRTNAVLLVSGALLVVLMKWILPANLPGLPFGVSLWLSALTTLIGVISWNSVGDAFDIRSFKRVAKWVGVAGSVGALVSGFAIPLLVKALSTDSLLIVLAASVVMSAGGLTQLSSSKAASSTRSRTKRGSPLRYPLFLYVAGGIGILLFVDVLSDFVLKRELGAAFDKDGIASFMGPFYGLSSGVTLVVQFGVTDRLLKRFGVAGLLAAAPILCLLGVAAVFVSPGLWTGALLRFIESVGYYGLYSVGKEIADTPLPSAIRRTSKLLLKGVVSPVGTGAAALSLFFLEGHDVRFIAGAIGLVCVAWFYTIYRTKQAYQSTLNEAVRTKRFGLEMVSENAGVPVNLNEVYREVFTSGDEDAVLIGLNLLAAEAGAPLPKEALVRLDDPSPRIRRAVAHSARMLEFRPAVPRLLARLTHETDEETAWYLLYAVAHLAPEAGMNTASTLIEHASLKIRAGALLILLRHGDLDGLIVAAPALKGMLSHRLPGMRAAAARVIEGLEGKLQQELVPLLCDEDDAVRMAAIKACHSNAPPQVVESLARMLGNGQMGQLSGLALIRMGERVLDDVLGIVHTGGVAAKRAAIRIIARIDSPTCENALLDLGRSREFEVSNIASEAAARRANRLETTATFEAGARTLAMKEADRVDALLTAESCSRLGNKVRIEVRARRRLAQNQFLHWYAVATHPKTVLEAIPAVLPPMTGCLDPARQAVAVELLDAIATDTALRQVLTQVFETKRAVSQKEAFEQLKLVSDPWLDRLLIVHSGVPQPEGTMDLFDRAALLRKVDLFEALPGDVLLFIAELTEPVEMFAGDVIFEENSASDCFYVIASGSVEIRKGERRLAELQAPHYFGELGLLDDSPRLGAAYAIADGLLMRIDRENFYQITQDLPEVLRAIIRKLAQYVRGADTSST